MEMIGKSDSYIILYVQFLFKEKKWNEAFPLDVEDKETQSLITEVLDKDIDQDKKLGILKYSLLELKPETLKKINLKLMPSLDTNKIKDRKEGGTITNKVHYHEYSKEEQHGDIRRKSQEKVESTSLRKEETLKKNAKQAFNASKRILGIGWQHSKKGLQFGSRRQSM